MAVEDSGLSLDGENPERIGVVMGTGLVPMDLPDVAPFVTEAWGEDGQLHTERMGRRGSGALFPLWVLKYLPNMTAAHISLIKDLSCGLCESIEMRLSRKEIGCRERPF